MAYVCPFFPLYIYHCSFTSKTCYKPKPSPSYHSGLKYISYETNHGKFHNYVHTDQIVPNCFIKNITVPNTTVTNITLHNSTVPNTTVPNITIHNSTVPNITVQYKHSRAPGKDLLSELLLSMFAPAVFSSN